MLFEGKLYTTVNLCCTAESLHADIDINFNHPVFSGHFPGNPVFPGVCTLQVIGELLSGNLKREYTLIKSENIKFIALVVPSEKAMLHYEILFSKSGENSIAVKCTVTSNEKEVLKMKGSYICL